MSNPYRGPSIDVPNELKLGYLVGSIYGRFSIKNAHFVLIRSQTGPPQAIGRFLKIFSSETA
jgi:hypothetical protein